MKSLKKICIFKSLNNIFWEYLEIILYPKELPKHPSNIWIRFKTFYFIYFLLFLKLILLITVSWICLYGLGFSPAGSLSIVKKKKRGSQWIYHKLFARFLKYPTTMNFLLAVFLQSFLSLVFKILARLIFLCTCFCLIWRLNKVKV